MELSLVRLVVFFSVSSWLFLGDHRDDLVPKNSSECSVGPFSHFFPFFVDLFFGQARKIVLYDELVGPVSLK